MPLNSKLTASRLALARHDDLTFKVFLFSTIFIAVFSITAIHSWPPLAEKFSILLACVLPMGMLVYSRIPIWFHEKQIPMEVLWVLSVSVLGIISSLLSANLWPTLKSTVLFLLSGPFIFMTTKYLFESKRNQEVFLWVMGIGLLIISFYGIYQYNFSYKIAAHTKIRLFSSNPLPAGGLLILLLASPFILINRKNPLALRIILTLTLVFAMAVILLLAKKGPLLSLVVILLSMAFFISRKYLGLLLGCAFFLGCLLYFSGSTLVRYKHIVRLKQSVALRVENYFFGIHVFKENPIWGMGFKADLLPQLLEDYDFKLSAQLPKEQYRSYVEANKTFDNIILAFLVELGGLFTVTYFAGLIYIIVRCSRNSRSPPQRNRAPTLAMSVLMGFAVLSLTFDTLRFPDLNWVFHSLLGLLVNFGEKSSEDSVSTVEV
jgi:hypothetical protein